MKVLITGVAGFIGSSIADRLIREPAVEGIVGVDCFLDYYPRALKERNIAALRENPKFELVEERMTEADWPALLDGVKDIYHQAAQAGVRASWGEQFSIYTDSNVLATQKLLEACKGREVRIVAASSSSVYGETRKLPMHEDDRPQPVSPYGVTKLAAEHLGVLYTRNFHIPVMSLRYFTVYGPRQRPDMAFTRFIQAGLLGQPIEIYGDGEQTRDFTFIDDAVQANVLAMRQGRAGTVYNIGGGSRVSVNEVLRTIEEIIGKKLDVRYKDRAMGDVTHTFADTGRAREQLGFRPQVPLREGLERQVKWVEEEILPEVGSKSRT